jgi:hypothetical protein
MTGGSVEGFAMRHVIPVLLAAFAVFPIGCNWLKSSGGTTKKNDQPLVKAPQRQPAEFVGYLNRQAGYLQTVRYDDIDVSIKLPNQWVPGLNNGMIVCGKPNHFRMTAALIAGGKQLDIGSNANEMWMYVKQSDPQYLYCSHSEFPKVQDNLPVKFEPAWVLQALGMTTYDPNPEKYTVRYVPNRDSYDLYYYDTTAAGEKVLKLTEFAANMTGDTAPDVRRHVVLTADAKQKIAVATIKKVSNQKVGVDPASGNPTWVQVPTEVTLEWPQQNVKMDLQLGRIKLNETLTTTEFDSLFRRPNSIGSARPVNLAEYLTSQRAGGGVSRGSRPDDALPRR